MMGVSILRANLPRATASERVGVIRRSGFRSSFRTKAAAAKSLSPRGRPFISPRGGTGAFNNSRETRTRPSVNLRASIPLTPLGARKFPSASRRGGFSLGP
jgi:hypothetical protein